MYFHKRLPGAQLQWFLVVACAMLLCCPASAFTQATSPWPAIAQDELALRDNAAHPGDAAMILYREVQTDNAKSTEIHFTRIKVFKDEGKKYANIEIPYLQDEVQVENIQARTVAPDGKPTEFDGTIYDKVLVKFRRLRWNAKAFTLPNVQPGSILEYSYRLHFHRGIPDVIRNPQHYIVTFNIAYPAAHWPVQRDLFIRRARFVLHPVSPRTHIEFRLIRLPKVNPPQQQPDGSMQIEVENIPGVAEEEYSPPEDAMRGGVYLYYVVSSFFSNENFWQDLARFESGELEKFLSKSKAIQLEAFRLIAPNDDAETKLHKLYSRAQQVRAVSFEPSKTEKEKADLKPNKTVEDVLAHGYGFGNEINLLFVALARAAGFNAYPVRVASRNRTFFLKGVPDPRQLDSSLVEVDIPGKTLYLDPATPHCPYGLLPWEETDTQGIRLDAFNSRLVQVPVASVTDAVIERKGKFRLDKDGNLEGKLEVDFDGQEALVRRLSENNKDETSRKESLEDEARKWLPQSATAKLDVVSGWDEANGPLHAVFDVHVPNFAVQAGDRLLFPIVVFHPSEGKAFQASHRENPVYLKYAHQEIDDISVQIPQGFKVESLPTPHGQRRRFATYNLAPEQHGGELKLKRNLVMGEYYFNVEQYPQLREFYDFVRSNDEEQAILQVLPAS